MTSRRPSLRRSMALVWRTLRSMRTALVLLLVLAGGAVIGSLLPQIPNSPQRVGQYLDGHGFWGPLFFRAGFFDVFGSAPVVTASIDGHRLWGSPIQMVRDDAPEGVPATAMPWRGAIKLTEPEPDVMVTLELWPDFRALANLQLTGRPTPMLVEFDPYVRYSVYTGRILDPARSTIMPVGLRRIGRGQIHAAGTGSISVPGVGDLRLAFPELRHYSVLLVSRDVGVPVVLAAAILVLVGLLPALFVSRRKVWIRAEPAPGGSTVEVGGFALQRKDAFEEEFARIVRAVEASAGAVPARPSEPVGTP